MVVETILRTLHYMNKTCVLCFIQRSGGYNTKNITLDHEIVVFIGSKNNRNNVPIYHQHFMHISQILHYAIYNTFSANDNTLVYLLQLQKLR